MTYPTPPTDPSQPTPVPVVPVPTPPPTPASAIPAPVAPAVTAAVAFDPAAMPADAQEYLRKAIAEADTKARLTSKANAAKEAEAALSAKIATALGLAPDAASDPAALTAQLTAARDRTRALEVEREVSRLARKHGADEDLLTAVLVHRGKIATLDPSADGFADALDALVKSEVDANPKLRASGANAPAPGAQGAAGSFAAGTGADPTITEAMLKTMTPVQIEKALAEGKLNHLL